MDTQDDSGQEHPGYAVVRQIVAYAERVLAVRPDWPLREMPIEWIDFVKVHDAMRRSWEGKEPFPTLAVAAERDCIEIAGVRLRPMRPLS